MVPSFHRFLLESSADLNHPGLAGLSPELKFEISHGIVDSRSLLAAAAAGEVELKLLIRLGLVDFEDLNLPDFDLPSDDLGLRSVVQHLGFPKITRFVRISGPYRTLDPVGEAVADRFLVWNRGSSYQDLIVDPEIKPDWKGSSFVWNLRLGGRPVSIIEPSLFQLRIVYNPDDWNLSGSEPHRPSTSQYRLY